MLKKHHMRILFPLMVLFLGLSLQVRAQSSESFGSPSNNQGGK